MKKHKTYLIIRHGFCYPFIFIMVVLALFSWPTNSSAQDNDRIESEILEVNNPNQNGLPFLALSPKENASEKYDEYAIPQALLFCKLKGFNGVLSYKLAWHEKRMNVMRFNSNGELKVTTETLKSVGYSCAKHPISNCWDTFDYAVFKKITCSKNLTNKSQAAQAESEEKIKEKKESDISSINGIFGIFKLLGTKSGSSARSF